jgi:hypothetical protein
MRPRRPFYCRLVLEPEMESQPSQTSSPSCCGRHCSSSSTPWPFPSPWWSSPKFLITKIFMAPSVSSKTQLTRLERTWRLRFHACAHVVGPCIVCMGVMSSSSPHLIWSLPRLRRWPSNPRMYKAFRPKNRRHWFLIDSRHHLPMTILISSNCILMWDLLCWKAYLLSFPTVSWMLKIESVCILGIHFRETHSCSPNRIRAGQKTRNLKLEPEIPKTRILFGNFG